MADRDAFQDCGLFGSVRVWNCLRCGALVASRGQHNEWHAELPDRLRRWVEQGRDTNVHVQVHPHDDDRFASGLAAGYQEGRRRG